MGKSFLALDVGSGSIKAIIAEESKDGRVLIRAGLEKPSKGLRRGVVVDMESASAQIISMLRSVKDISKDAHKNIFLGVGGVDVKSRISEGSTAVSRANSEIHKDDIARAVQASLAVSLPSNRMILHTLKQEFIVDGIGDIQDPLGMVGTKLEVVSYIIDAFGPAVKNLQKCVELAGGSISAMIFNPLASAFAVLTQNQKELGVVLADIGHSTTGIAVYEEGKLLHTVMLPIGAGHVTNDLAIALKIPVESAEKIKLRYGDAIAKLTPARENIDLKEINPKLEGTISRRFVAEVIESRLSELCELINEELKKIGKTARLPGGVVLVGGGAKHPGMLELFRAELKLTSQIGFPSPSLFEAESGAMGEYLESQEFACALGLSLWERDITPKPATNSYKEKIVKLFRNFMP
ncbi:MAG: cell division protein FtsA [Candidatus Colwellbacteria bacterium]|nr:cell division protein FtsA [Candidatus Colwellbacteria bacterium]